MHLFLVRPSKKNIHTHTANHIGTPIHPSPRTHVPLSSFLYPPLALLVKVREGMPFSFSTFFARFFELVDMKIHDGKSRRKL